MADPLSAVANAAAIVGLVDVSFRAAKKLYVSFSAVKGASKEVKSLQNELQDINTILRLLSDNGGSPHSF
jgi:Fungal N-terminal domain of STAND proteins